MNVIRDKDGNAVQRSKNLRGIRAYVGKHIVKTLDVSEVGSGEGKLSILFDNGCSFETTFASLTVLRLFVSQWRNAYGAPLTLDGKPAGIVSPNVTIYTARIS